MYPLMDGKNFDLLRVFFTVLKSCSKEDGEEEEEEEGRGSIAELKPEIHLKLLQGLKVPLKGAVEGFVYTCVCVCMHACVCVCVHVDAAILILSYCYTHTHTHVHYCEGIYCMLAA